MSGLFLSALLYAEPQPTTSVLVINTRAIGLKDDLTPITEKIAAVVSAKSSYSAMTMADIGDLVAHENSKQLLGCEDSACFSQLGNTVNTDFFVTSSVGAVGDSFVFTISLLDTRTASSPRKASRTLQRLDELNSAVPQLLAEVFDWEGRTKIAFKLHTGQKLSFAVLDLRATGVSPEVADNLTQVLSAEIKQSEGSTVVSRDDIRAMLQLESDKALLSCADTSCIAEIGGALGVDKLVVGQVGKLSETYFVSLRLIDPSTAKVDSRVTESYVGKEEQLIGAVKHSAHRLLGVQARAGSISVSSTIPEAEVFLDNQSKGRLPMPTIKEVASGRHLLKVAGDGYYSWQTEIYVNPGENTAVWAELEQIPVKWYQRWWVWAGGVALTIAAAGAISTGLYYGLSGPNTGSVTVTAQKPGGDL